jgi:hypothetical protein
MDEPAVVLSLLSLLSPREIGLRLVGRYETVHALTVQIHAALERDDTTPLAALVAARATELHAVDGDLRALGARAAAIPAEERDRLRAALVALQDRDAAVRALLSSRTQELPAQLAQVRGSRARLGGGYGYFSATPDLPERVDCRG